jgi:hypothetical protein
MTFRELQERSRWLLQHASNVTSENGEDGIISKALELLPQRNGWCIEFGAWDGRKASNTYNLITASAYRGVLIEADPVRFRDLQKTHDPQKNIMINATVGFDARDSLDVLLSDRQVPSDVDVLSIDIDGNDYHVWAAINSLRPKLVVIEFNPTIANAVRFIQERRTGITQGASAAALIELAKSKSYELISVAGWNLIFADARYYALFHIPDNSLAVMCDETWVSQIFEGIDGTVFLSNNGKLGGMRSVWHPDLVLPEQQVQILPRGLRKHPGLYNRTELFLYRWWIRLRWRGLV